MIKDIVLPDLGEGIESATISEIPLSAGEHVKKDDVLLVLESDKASMEIPSDYDGKVVEILIEEGKDVVTGEPLFKIEIQDGLKEKVEEHVDFCEFFGFGSNFSIEFFAFSMQFSVK